MSNENGSVSVHVTTQATNPSFLSDSTALSQLKKLLKDFNKNSSKALEALIGVMETTKDEKLKAQCAKDILQMTVQLAKEVNTDQMQRLIAEIKFNRGPQGKLVQLEDDKDEDEKLPPKVDFSVIKVV